MSRLKQRFSNLSLRMFMNYRLIPEKAILNLCAHKA